MTRLLPLLLMLAPTAAAADPAAAARGVDAHLAARWAREGVEPAGLCDDATFVRRVHLDLVGRIPTAADTRAFLADPAPDKRELLIDRLVAQPGSATHFARVWRWHWLPQTAAQFEELRPEFEDWLRGQLRENVPYDRMVRSLLAPPAGPAVGRSAQVFLQANEYKPANLAGNSARLFLGLNLDCAQCHDHPFARWTKEQFWQQAAFFAEPSAGGPPRVALPNAAADVSPRFVDGGEPAWDGRTGRAVYADWLVSAKNPYFARHAVNRVWADLLGTGLAEPLDDLSGDVPPQQPEVLDDLAGAFAAEGFDLRFLLRTIMRTRAYQLASAAPAAEPHLFARFAPRTMSGDQLYDSLALAAGLENPDRYRDAFVTRFGHAERPAEAGRTVLQALTMMNGPATGEATALTGRGTLAAVADAPFLDTKGRVEALFLAALSRRPTADEDKKYGAVVEAADGRRGLATLFWVLLNGNEFAVVH